VATLTVRRVAAHAVTASWSGATDNRGVVGYQVQLDSRAIRNSPERTFRFTNVVAGTHRIVVRALDGAGNLGPAKRVVFSF
jgi:hypothetical protein